ncbi:MAG: hypothetical protein WC869_16955 [Phycisphaerae bacterium]
MSARKSQLRKLLADLRREIPRDVSGFSPANALDRLIEAAKLLHAEPNTTRKLLTFYGWCVRTYDLRPGTFYDRTDPKHPRVNGHSTELYTTVNLIEIFGRGAAWPKGGAVYAQLIDSGGQKFEAKINCAPTRQFNGRVLREAAIEKAHCSDPVKAFRFDFDAKAEA